MLFFRTTIFLCRFVKSLLVKSKNSVYWDTLYTVDSKTLHASAWNRVGILSDNPLITVAWTYKAIWEVKATGDKVSYLTLWPMGEEQDTITSEDRVSFEYSATYQANQRLNFWARIWANNSYVYVRNVQVIFGKIDCTNSRFINWIPTKVVNIWEKWYINLFWMIDWEWNYWPEKPSDHEFSSTATVGSITPWNYTWYLTIKWADWKTYKVWVYNV